MTETGGRVGRWHSMASCVAAMMVCGAAWAQAPSGGGAAQSAAEAPPGRVKGCIECHEGLYAITRTKHAVKGDARTPTGSNAECDGCHGDTAQHNLTPRVPGLVPVAFGKKAAPGPQNEACLNCHQSGTRIHWQGSAHERSQQNCASCHRMHAPRDPVMVTETQASVCFDCHKDRRAEMHRLSTHPTKSGFIACGSCHASHGSTTRASLQRASVNDTCYTCHADKRGPFLWEHRPSQDDCTHCHNPHGTNNTPMLKVRMPYLCQQCHQTASHSSVAYSGNQLAPLAANAERMIGGACVNCHMKVHGSNHPSGARLQR